MDCISILLVSVIETKYLSLVFFLISVNFFTCSVFALQTVGYIYV